MLFYNRRRSALSGPLEAPYPSPAFRQNFTSIQQYAYSSWNGFNQLTNHVALPHRPFDVPVIPTEARLTNDTSHGFRPINNGIGGSGKEFAEAIGGNSHREQFTGRLSYFPLSLLLLFQNCIRNYLFHTHHKNLGPEGCILSGAANNFQNFDLGGSHKVIKL